MVESNIQELWFKVDNKLYKKFENRVCPLQAEITLMNFQDSIDASLWANLRNKIEFETKVFIR